MSCGCSATAGEVAATAAAAAATAAALFLVRWRLLVVPFSEFFFDRLDGEGLEAAAGG